MGPSGARLTSRVSARHSLRLRRGLFRAILSNIAVLARIAELFGGRAGTSDVRGLTQQMNVGDA
jgi:hypothetical protein